MNSVLKGIFIFTTGAATGALIANQILKEKYEKIANEEIASVKEVYDNKNSKTIAKEESSEEEDDKEDIKTYQQILEDNEYIVKEEGYEEMENPRLIDPYDFGSEYETISLTYYADGILEDDLSGQVLTDPRLLKDLVCEDYVDHFGDYEEDTVFLRNDETMKDIEICKDRRRYSDLVDGDE